MATANRSAGTPRQDDFYKQFSSERAILQDQIDGVGVSNDRKSAVDACLVGISHLTKTVQDASDFLPSYDQRSYADSIKALSARLNDAREASAPRAKFSFKNKLKTTPKTPPSESTAASESTVPVENSPTVEGTHEAVLADLTGVYRTLRSSATNYPTSVTIHDVATSIIDASSTGTASRRLATLTSRNIAQSIVLCGHVEGPIHVTGLSHSIVVAACRQFRMHEAIDCDVYLHCSSNPIIEHCSNVRFAPLPKHLEASWNPSGENRWDVVQDFNWLRPEASPNWSRLPDSERVLSAYWKKLDPQFLDGPDDIDNVLQAVGLNIRGEASV